MSKPANRTLTCGVDVGARTVDVAVFDGEKLIGSVVLRSVPQPREAAREAHARALETAGVSPDDIALTIATGYGRNNFEGADETASEIVCHAAGVLHFLPGSRTIIDIGGQDSKAIHINPAGRVVNFSMNDRCAAGTGRFIEMVADTLGLPLDQAGHLALQSDRSCKINSMCAVFAESEIVGLLQSGVEPGAILRGVFESVARRTLALLGDFNRDTGLVFTGGVAKNPGMVEAVRRETATNVSIPPDPQITGALGAAIIAAGKTAGT